MKYTPEQLEALRAAVGARLIILRAGDEEIAVQRVDGETYKELREIAADDPDWQELALRRAVALPQDLPRVDALLQEDPQLGDVLGAQLLAAAGVQARTHVRKGEGRAVVVVVRINLPGGEVLEIPGSRPGAGTWKDVRRVIARSGPDAGALRVYELCAKPPEGLADRYPALPQVVGAALMGSLTREAGNPSL